MQQPFLPRQFSLWGGLLAPALLLLVVLLLLLQPGASTPAAAAQRSAPLPDGGEEREIEGLLLSRPTDTLLGNWEIQSEHHFTAVIVADASTRFDWGIPNADDFVKAKYREQPDGTLLATRLRPAEYEAGEVIVRLAEGVFSTTVASRYDLRPETTLLASGHIYRFRTHDDDDDVQQLITQLTADPDVIWAELNYIGGILEGHPYKVWHWGGSDPAGYINQAAYQQVNLAPAWEYARGSDVIIAILDTGIDLGHPEFATGVLNGWDMVDDDNLPQDEPHGLAWGHGTHVAGIIAHIAPDSQILPVRVLDSNGLGNTFTLAYAVEWAVQQGATVINLSLGTEADSRVLHTALQYAMDQGVTIVAAAGNGDTNQAQFPVAYPGVIGVTAVDAANHKADFANYSSEWVDLAAPGVGITSTIIGEDGSGYASWSGTSMSTAFVSGATALTRQLAPTASVTATLQLFQTHGANLDPLNAGYEGQIGRLLNIGAAVARLAPLVSPTATPSVTATPQPSATSVGQASPTPTPTATTTPTTVAGNQSIRQYLPFVVR